ncbi:MAG: hypothetical protein IT440_10590 [Phycisphaeraceae bacterium]|nr:hypothetical protein [Phycisphaeraceae bacterium]
MRSLIFTAAKPVFVDFDPDDPVFPPMIPEGSKSDPRRAKLLSHAALRFDPPVIPE